MELIATAAAALSVSLSLARTGSQVHAALATGDVVAQISRRNRVLSAACAIFGLSCRSLSGIETWLACASLLNATASIVALLPHRTSLRGRRADRHTDSGKVVHA